MCCVSEGQWKVWVTTNELATAGTTAQVTLTVYGHKGQTNPLPLGFGDGQHFQNGHIDEFDVSVSTDMCVCVCVCVCVRVCVCVCVCVDV